jgi:hypothetical protein
VTEHVATPADPDSVHVWAEKAPAPVVDQPTWPVGVTAAPLLVSRTVAVQVDPEPTRTGVSQATVMEVDRAVPVICVDPTPDVCRWSPPYVAVTVGVPEAAGVKVTEQLAAAPVPARVHDVAENVPWPPEDQPMVPLGVAGVPLSVSVTVAVQVAGEPTTTEESHWTAVEICRSVPVTLDDEAPPRCVVSPG